jgi:hypothetical protein
MKPAKIILILLGVSLATLAAFGAVSLYRHHPRVFLGGATVLAVLFVMASLSDRRSRRELAAAETVLARTACPLCGALFGREAASLAIHPPRPPNMKYMIADDQGYSTVTCPGCGARSLFHRLTHELSSTPQRNVA